MDLSEELEIKALQPLDHLDASSLVIFAGYQVVNADADVF